MSIETLWFGRSPWASMGRAILSPLSLLFRGGVAVRNQLYDRKLLPIMPSAVPVLSVGNISVGGTGKTPVAAYFVRRLLEQGRMPALVMRGYGADEPDVHRLLNPSVGVYTNPDRVAAIEAAVADGADVIVLDDAFQHRRAGRQVDVVLVSAERWRDGEQVLPAGSLREPPSALRRAGLVIVTQKVADRSTVDHVLDATRRIAPEVPVASVHLRLDRCAIVPSEANPEAREEMISLGVLADTSVLAIAGIGDPESFFRQLDAVGATVTRAPFSDHHPYTREDAAHLAELGKDHKYIVSTLKDAVKLRHVWPPKGPCLWYVSQAVEVSAGSALIDATVWQLLL